MTNDRNTTKRQERALTVRLIDDDYERLARAADALGLSMSATGRLVLRRALQERLLERLSAPEPGIYA